MPLPPPLSPVAVLLVGDSAAPQIAITVALALFAGLLAQLVARRFRVPAIVPLMLFGIALGPEGFGRAFGGLVDPKVLGDGLQVIVGIGVAIILFEGGLTLDRATLARGARPVRNLVTIGALLTWGLAALGAWLLFPRLGAGLATLFGALVIVTGPTVITPLLRVVRPGRRIAAVLRGEAILIDPVGALLAVLTLDAVIAFEREGGIGSALTLFGQRLLIGTGLGIGGALGLAALLRHPAMRSGGGELRNYLGLTAAILLYAISEAASPESGVLTVTLAGLLLGWKRPPGIEELTEFKGHLTMVGVSMVFVLLAANLPLGATLDLGWRGLTLLLVIVFVVRPLVIFVCTLGTELERREKLFLSWVAPRGIVAAAVSSLFALVLEERGIAGAELLLPLTFTIILGTVLLQGPTAGPWARRLGVAERHPAGFLIMGANRAARALASVLKDVGRPVFLLDSNAYHVGTAREAGLEVRRANAVDEALIDDLELAGLGHFLAMTPSDSANRLAVRLYGRILGEENCRAVALMHSPRVDAEAEGPRPLFGGRLRFEELEARLREGATLETARIEEDVEVNALEPDLDGGIPLLLLTPDKKVRWIGESERARADDLLVVLRPAEPSAPVSEKDS